MKRKSELIVAKTAGFCFGVNRAVDIVEDLVGLGKKVATLGPIIHNKRVIEELKNKGVRIIEIPDEIKQDEVMVIRSHGTLKEIYKKAELISVQDATCMFVQKIHKIVDENSSDGETVLIAGDKTHPEVISIKSFIKTKAYVFKDTDELTKIILNNELKNKKVIMVAQTTFLSSKWIEMEKILQKLCTNYKIFDTICKATQSRQSEADDLSKQVDLMLVVGDKLSSNTKKLLKTCERNCKSILVEKKEDIDYSIKNYKKIGLTASASAPARIIEEVIKVVEEIKNDGLEENNASGTNSLNEEQKLENAEDGQSFEELLNNSTQQAFVKMGSKVKGIISGISKNEVQVDLGCKQTGIIPMAELSLTGLQSPEDVVKNGDEVEAIVIKKNDQDGIITLSKKRVDEIKGYETLEQAFKDDNILKGKISSVVKGGVLAVTKDGEVFIPLSQLSTVRIDDPNQKLGEEVEFKLIEANASKKKAVGSVRKVLDEKSTENQEELWKNIELGQKYTGIVNTLTNFGAFVDIGGVDGLIHISDLSWSRIKHPSEVVKVGEKVEVYIKDINQETRKIALGYKKTEENPFEHFKLKYHVGDVLDVKITGLTAFGAFAEIMPHIEGLIHVSQISNERIEKPSDALEIGQQVKVKIVKIVNENQNIGLSIKALLKDKKEEEDNSIRKAVENIDGVELS